MRLLPSSLIVIACALLACEPESNDSAAGDIVTTDVPHWSLRLSTSFGGSMPAESHLVVGAASIAETPNGNFLVLNTGDARIAVYDSTGEWLQNLGQRGNGPGEYISPMDVAVAGDFVYVLDGARFTLLQFHLADLSFSREFRLGLENGPAVALDADPLGRLYIGFKPVPGVSDKQHMSVAVFDPAAGTATPLIQLETQAPVMRQVKSANEQRVTFLDPPFAPSPVWAAAHKGGVLFGNGEEFMVSHASLDRTDLVLISERNESQRPVTERERSEYLKRYELEPGTVTFPERHPFFTSIMAGPDSSIWLFSMKQDRGQWAVYGLDGRNRGTVQLGPRTRVVGASERALYLVSYDSLDAETLYRFRLERRE